MAGPRRGLRGRRALVAAALIALFAVPPVYMAVATPPPGPVRLPATDDERARYRVYVGDWGYHTSIVVEQPRGWRLGPLGREDAPFVEYAWGDRRFYMESNFWPHAVFAAAFLPT